MDPMQNQPVQNQQAPVNPTEMQPEMQAEKKSFGPLIGIAVVIAALIIGALYFWGQRLSSPEASQDIEVELSE